VLTASISQLRLVITPISAAAAAAWGSLGERRNAKFADVAACRCGAGRTTLLEVQRQQQQLDREGLEEVRDR